MRKWWPVFFCAAAMLMMSAAAQAQAPQANTVPFDAASLSSWHTSWSGNTVTLKGTLTSAFWGTDNFTYDWDPGDGGAHCTGTVSNQFVIECPHTYTGSVGALYTAVLSITDTTKNLVSPAASNCPTTVTHGACYYTSLNAPPPNLAVEVNNAIDNGLWYLHKHMRHYTTSGGQQAGDWWVCDGNAADTCSSGGQGPSALNCTAFQANGFLQNNTFPNPYSDDVRLCLNGVFDNLIVRGIGQVNIGFGLYNPDSNHNNVGVRYAGPSYENYQTGMSMDAIVATQTPTLPIPTGTALASSIASNGIVGSGPGGIYTYKDAVTDMVDNLAYCQAPGNGDEGGWHYNCGDWTGDNSVSQWAAIGLIPAARTFGFGSNADGGVTIPPQLLAADQHWLDYSFHPNGTNNGYFGYTNSNPIWGPFADTPSGMVQLAMNGLGRGKMTPGGNNAWDSAETYIRDNFGYQGYGAGSDLKDYYYGLFSFTKAMLLHDNSGTGLGNGGALTNLQSLDDPGTCAPPGVPVTSAGSGTGPCYPPIDWYHAQTSTYGGTDPTNGVARLLVNSQNPAGYWYGHNQSGQQYYFETGTAVTMLKHTVFKPVPVACFTANPAHVASGGPVTLDGRCSMDQNPTASLVTWQWDVTGTGGTNFIGPGDSHCLTASCSQIIYNFNLPTGASLPYNYPVRLRVTDNVPLSADVVGSVQISNPPNPPNANAGGPYNFCPNATATGSPIYKPFALDGSQSTNPDKGKTDGTPGAIPSTITAYDWDYSCANTWTSGHGAQVDATAAFDIASYFGKTFNVCLRVTNNDNLAFPTAGLTAGLSSVAAAQVWIHQPTDEVCTHCVQSLGAQAKAPVPGVAGNIQLYWTDTNTSAQFTIDHYNIYRSTSPTFNPFVQIAGAASTSPFIPAVKVSVPAGGTLHYQDNNVVGGTTYFYRVAPATASDMETCQGNVTIQVVLPKGR